MLGADDHITSWPKWPELVSLYSFRDVYCQQMVDIQEYPLESKTIEILPFVRFGAIIMLRNAVGGVTFPGKRCFEGVRFNVISITGGG